MHVLNREGEEIFDIETGMENSSRTHEKMLYVYVCVRLLWCVRMKLRPSRHHDPVSQERHQKISLDDFVKTILSPREIEIINS
jgi:hypothetical protein